MYQIKEENGSESVTVRFRLGFDAISVTNVLIEWGFRLRCCCLVISSGIGITLN